MQILDLFSLNETPIEDFNLIGDWSKGASFHKEQDRKILSNPRAQQQIIHKFRNTVVPFNMYFVNMPKYGDFAEIGEVSKEWIEKNMSKVASKIKINDDAVNIIYTNNKGDKRVPMTAWIIAHRLGHAINNVYPFINTQSQVPEFKHARDMIISYLSDIMKSYGYSNFPNKEEGFYQLSNDKYNRYKNMLKALYQSIGTMRSARSKNLRIEYEFQYELFAQYLLTGKVTFNPLPRVLKYGRFGNNKLVFRGTEPEYDHMNNQLNLLGEALEDQFYEVLHALIGRIFVM